MREYRIESVTETLKSLGVELTPEQIGAIVDDFSTHIEMENELSFGMRGGMGGKQECSKCKNLERELVEVRRTISIYNESVKTRRNASKVYIDNITESVMYVP